MTLCQTWFSLCTQLFCFFVSSIFLHFLTRIYIYFLFPYLHFLNFFFWKFPLFYFLFMFGLYAPYWELNTPPPPTANPMGPLSTCGVSCEIWKREIKTEEATTSWKVNELHISCAPSFRTKSWRKKKCKNSTILKRKKKEKKTHFTSKFRKSSQWIWQKTKITKKKTSLV